MATAKKGKVSDLLPDRKNANKHSQYGMKLLEKSVSELGMGRSILVSSDNEIIAGNGVTETAMASGIENTIVVETDGTQLVVVKRTDIKSNSPEFYKMALADNVVAQKNIVLDAVVVDEIISEGELGEFAESFGLVKSTPDDFNDPEYLKKKHEIYNNNNIKQIVLYFPTEQFESTLHELDTIGNEFGVDNNSDAVIKLIEFYHANKNK